MAIKKKNTRKTASMVMDLVNLTAAHGANNNVFIIFHVRGVRPEIDRNQTADEILAGENRLADHTFQQQINREVNNDGDEQQQANGTVGETATVVRINMGFLIGLLEDFRRELRRHEEE